MRSALIVCVVAVIAGVACAPKAHMTSVPAENLTFLTREGCAQSPRMRERLDEALTELGRPRNYVLIDADSLPSADPRRNYGTPTILVGTQDLFGMPAPPAGPDAPT